MGVSSQLSMGVRGHAPLVSRARPFTRSLREGRVWRLRRYFRALVLEFEVTCIDDDI